MKKEIRYLASGVLAGGTIFLTVEQSFGTALAICSIAGVFILITITSYFDNSKGN